MPEAWRKIDCNAMGIMVNKTMYAMAKYKLYMENCLEAGNVQQGMHHVLLTDSNMLSNKSKNTRLPAECCAFAREERTKGLGRTYDDARCEHLQAEK